MTGAWLASTAALGVLTFTAVSASATPSAKLTYSRGPGAEMCPDEAALRKAVAARLGYDPFFPWAAKTVVAKVTRAKKGFHGELSFVSAEGLVRGARALDAASDDCSDIVRALALAVSIALDDLALDEPEAAQTATEAPTSTPTPTPAPTATSTETPAPASTPISTSPAPRANLAPAVWLAPVLSFGTAPSPAVGFHADFRLSYRLMSVDLEAQGDVPASGGTSPKGLVSSYLLLGTLAPCVHWPAPLFACALATAGSFQETGVDLASPHSASAPFLGAGGRVGVEIPFLSRYFVLAHGDALGILLRHSVQIDGMTAFQQPALAGRVGIGAGVRF